MSFRVLQRTFRITIPSTSLPIQRLVETVAVDANTKADSEGNVKSRAAKRTTKRWEPVNELGIEGAEDEFDDEEVPS